MKIIYRYILAVLIISAVGCGESDENKLIVKGTIKDLEAVRKLYPSIFKNDSLKLYLYEVPFGAEANPVQLDTAFVGGQSGDFILEGLSRGEGLYDIMFEGGPVIPIVNDAAEITVNIDLQNKERYYSVSGSPATEQLRDFVFSYSDKSAAANTAFKRLDSLKLYQATDSLLLSATNAKNASVESLNRYVKDFLSNVNNSSVAAFVLGAASNTLPENEYEAVLNKLVQKYPADSNLTFLKKQVDIRKEQNASQEAARNSWVGKPAPELTLPDPSGNSVSLSSFKGKYVLVDFWASWCRPCRIENPNVVNAYNRFKDKNFTILGVSLDREKQSWLQAIREDQLAWSHVSDLEFWNSKAVDVFRFEGIPYNVLVDPNGVIIAEGLRGEALDAKLQQLLQ